MADLESRVEELEAAIFDLVVNPPKQEAVPSKRLTRVVKGAKGERGDRGESGKDGKDGKDGEKGERGERGLPGPNGEDGVDGVDGKSAYDIWLSKGKQGSEKQFLESLKGKDGEAGKLVIREVHGGAGTILKAGDVGRFESKNSISDDDDFLIKRNSSLFRVSAKTLADYVVQQNTTVRTITFEDSPYTIKEEDEYISADATDGNIVINLLPLATAPRKLIDFKKMDSTVHIVTIDPDGSEKIDGLTTEVISSQYNTVRLLPTASEWELR